MKRSGWAWQEMRLNCFRINVMLPSSILHIPSLLALSSCGSSTVYANPCFTDQNTHARYKISLYDDAPRASHLIRRWWIRRTLPTQEHRLEWVQRTGRRPDCHREREIPYSSSNVLCNTVCTPSKEADKKRAAGSLGIILSGVVSDGFTPLH